MLFHANSQVVRGRRPVLSTQKPKRNSVDCHVTKTFWFLAVAGHVNVSLVCRDEKIERSLRQSLPSHKGKQGIIIITRYNSICEKKNNSHNQDEIG